jgi:PAT family beta-lactamase induction signal transducer AmpG
MSAAPDGRRSWSESFRVYLHPRVLAMLFLGFSAGLPFLLIFSTLSAWMREAGVTLSAIGFFSWVGLAHSIKVFWAPVVDRLPIPWLTRTMGRRRSWMLVTMTAIGLGLIGMAVTDPAEQLWNMALFALIVALGSATQDIAVDAYRIEAVDRDLQGAMAGTYQLGYRLAVLVGGGGALYLADYQSWTVSYLAMAAMCLVGIVTVLVIREPEGGIDRATGQQEQRAVDFVARNPRMPPTLRSAIAWFIGAVVCPFVDFFARNGLLLATVILLFISVFRISDYTLGVMANPFYIDLGFTKSEIASVIKIYGFAMTILGVMAGGPLIARYGTMRPLLASAVLLSASNLLFALLAVTGKDLMLLTVVISVDNIATGLSGTVFLAYLAGLTNAAYTATQYALFSSLMSLPGKVLGGFSGKIAESGGYVTFFVYTAAIGIPSVLMVLYLMRRQKADPLQEPAA